jgi:hypothetical protein
VVGRAFSFMLMVVVRLFLTMVTLIVCWGVVCSSRYVDSWSKLVILVWSICIMMSPPMVMYCPAISVCYVPLCRPALSAGADSVFCGSAFLCIGV